jgi:hypothetical protein
LPLSAADKAFCGQELPLYQERLRFEGDDPHWGPLDFSYLLEDGSLPPTLLIGGWYDYHRPPRSAATARCSPGSTVT